ncbi:MAG: peptidase U32 family protein [Victivallales bacterium]|jgi:putative protease
MVNQVKKTEITAPAGSLESLSAAIRAGADSVYFGVEKLNMRSHSSANFTLRDLAKIAKLCGKANVKSYLALNTVIYDSDIAEMKKICDSAKSAGISAIIASDIAVMEYAHSIGLPVHVSVQANVSNTGAVRFFAKFADAIVLARELTLQQIAAITSAIRKERIKGPSGELLKIEIFVHGALCVSISGKCYMSLAVYNTSANRGECYQSCRRKYRVTDEETGYEMLVDNKYVMSPKDLCTIRIIDKILDAGVSILKIEGRGRSADYVSAVTGAYREAVESCSSGKFSARDLERVEKELGSVFNRGFWHGGYYLGDKSGEWSGISGSRAEKKKTQIGIITNYFHRPGIAEVTLTAGGMKIGDEILATGRTTGAVKMVISGIRVDGKESFTAEKGGVATFPSGVKLRRGDNIYLLSVTGLE